MNPSLPTADSPSLSAENTKAAGVRRSGLSAAGFPEPLTYPIVEPEVLFDFADACERAGLHEAAFHWRWGAFAAIWARIERLPVGEQVRSALFVEAYRAFRELQRR